MPSGNRKDHRGDDGEKRELHGGGEAFEHNAERRGAIGQRGSQIAVCKAFNEMQILDVERLVEAELGARRDDLFVACTLTYVEIGWGRQDAWQET